MNFPSRADKFAQVLCQAQTSGRKKSRLSLEQGLNQAFKILKKAKQAERHVYLVGNGGSAAVASHAITDFINAAGLRASTLHEPSILTCLSNDYGYETAFARNLSRHARPGDVLVAISSSGRSKNILNAVHAMRQKKGVVITLSGFDAANPLRSKGDINIWLDSRDYGQVEVGHLFVLHHLADSFGNRTNGA